MNDEASKAEKRTNGTKRNKTTQSGAKNFEKNARNLKTKKAKQVMHGLVAKYRFLSLGE